MAPSEASASVPPPSTPPPPPESEAPATAEGNEELRRQLEAAREKNAALKKGKDKNTPGGLTSSTVEVDIHAAPV